MKQAYRIFHLIKGLGRGGAEVLLQDGFSYRNSSKFVYGYGYFLPWKNALVATLESSGAEVVCFNRKSFAGMLLSTLEVSDFLKRWGADLVHCHLPLAAVTGRLAAKKSKTPLIYTEHNVMERYHAATRWANLCTWKMQDAVVAVSQEVATSIGRRAGSSVPVTVVENGIAVEKFNPSKTERISIRREQGIPEGAIVIGNVAVFRVQKDLKSWLVAAKSVLEKTPDVYFLLVGDGPLRKEVEDFAQSLQLNHLRFAGLQQNVIPFYSAMDIFLSSSIFEGLPLALLEAMAMKLPVVVTSVGGVPGVVENGKSGFLVPAQKPELLAEKLQILLENPTLRSQFGQEARRTVESKFSMQKMITQLETLYQNILETPPRVR